MVILADLFSYSGFTSKSSVEADYIFAYGFVIREIVLFLLGIGTLKQYLIKKKIKNYFSGVLPNHYKLKILRPLKQENYYYILVDIILKPIDERIYGIIIKSDLSGNIFEENVFELIDLTEEKYKLDILKYNRDLKIETLI